MRTKSEKIGRELSKRFHCALFMGFVGLPVAISGCCRGYRDNPNASLPPIQSVGVLGSWVTGAH